jgi:putative ABC transport system permease protein
VAAIQSLPFSGTGGSRSFDIEGRQVRRPDDQADEQLRIVTDGYFAAMHIPLVTGREFQRSDAADTPRVAVVNEAFARKFFPSGRATGHRITFSKAEPRWYEIVGVAGNIKHRGLDAPDRPELYVPYKQPLFDSWTVRPMYVVVRSANEPASLVPLIRRAIARLDPEQPIADVRTMTDRIAESLAARRFTVMALAVFAGFALALAAIGLYGVISYAVGQRTKEIGVRIALGAQRSDVRRMIVGHGMMLAAFGTILGLAAAATLNRLVASQLYGVGVMDPATFGLVPVALLAAAFAACYLPARRATTIEALTALREE